MTNDQQPSPESTGDRRYELHIFCDFDGTISGRDIGYDLFATFGQQEPWHSQLMAGELHIRDYWRQMARGLHTPLTPELLDDYLRSIPIDPGAAELLALARAEVIPFTIVSDGMDLYIQRFLELHGMADVEFFSNHAELSPSGELTITYPYAYEGCNCHCATCKRNLVLWRARPDVRIVYIGDGVSDYCPAEHADIIFAKKRLAAYCNQQRLPHYPFADLSAVARQLRKLLARRRIPPRHQAHLRRKGVWEWE
jgi:2,3-diketo-5-methylthio-1-phosphopentane phosphatase